MTRLPHHESWFTPPSIIEAARAVLGGFDLDPASCRAANETVRAVNICSLGSTPAACDVERRWTGRVWLNPPYSRKIRAFVGKLVSEYEHPAGGVTEAILLTNASVDTTWWRLAASRASSICFTRGRIQFLCNGEPVGSPPCGQSFFYFGPRPDAFKNAFGAIGYFVRFES